jgi:flagellar assembly protein FliH
MLLSYKVIKNDSVKSTGAKEIVTDTEVKTINSEAEENVKNNFESYESLAKTLIENARRQSEAILSRAYAEASSIEEEAVINAETIKQQAYEQGFSQGQQEGYENAYNQTIGSAQEEASAIIASAETLLNEAKYQYEEYLKAKTEEINNLILAITSTVLKKEIEDSSTIRAMIYEVLEASKQAKTFIIRTNIAYTAEIKAETDTWKEHLGFKGDIFIVADDSIELGNALIDKGNGKVMVGVNTALSKIKDILEGKD